MCGRSAPHCVCLAVPNRRQPGVLTRQAPHCGRTSTPANLYNIDLGHKSRDQCLIRNIKPEGSVEKY